MPWDSSRLVRVLQTFLGTHPAPHKFGWGLHPKFQNNPIFFPTLTPQRSTDPRLIFLSVSSVSTLLIPVQSHFQLQKRKLECSKDKFFHNWKCFSCSMFQLFIRIYDFLQATSLFAHCELFFNIYFLLRQNICTSILVIFLLTGKQFLTKT